MKNTKQTAKHTAGEWYNDNGSIMTKIDGVKLQLAIISRTKFCGKLTAREEDLEKMLKDTEGANARLIASAPALLSACEIAVEIIRDSFGDENGCDSDCQAVRILEKAIAKAKGE